MEDKSSDHKTSGTRLSSSTRQEERVVIQIHLFPFDTGTHGDLTPIIIKLDILLLINLEKPKISIIIFTKHVIYDPPPPQVEPPKAAPLLPPT